MGNEHQQLKMTSVEISKLWATYMGNSMSIQILEYFLKHVEDQEIRDIVNQALEICKEIITSITNIFNEENFPVPNGFTEGDVNKNAPRLFHDEFYLHYLKYTCKAGMSLYSLAIPLMTRSDIRELFIHTLTKTIGLITNVINAMLDKGFLIKPPTIPYPDRIEFIHKQEYLNGFFGNRPLQGLEITHLYDNIENNVASKALLVGFSQVVKDEKIKKYFIRGRDITARHIESSSKMLRKENLPAPNLLDHLVTTSNEPPFSDKLMLFHKIDMFSMKIRMYGNASSLSSRRDLGAMYAKNLMDISLFVEDGANLMIDYGWMEQPPQAANRDMLSK
jgi:spore coat protein CotF